MIRLTDVTEENWMDVASLSVHDSQKHYSASAEGILARGYVFRNHHARVFAIENDGTIIGAALVREFSDEPLGYDLQQFLIDRRHQGNGYGSAALGLILDELRKENHYDHVEVCVKKEDIPAIRLYEKLGFADSGYIDKDVPDSLNMICYLVPRSEETANKTGEKIIAACGNDCSACPRYTAHPYEKTAEELQHTARLWMKIGYRDHVASNEEISCTGCSPSNRCRYQVVRCCEGKKIKTCAECADFPCENMKHCFSVTVSFIPACREACSVSEFKKLQKAFFEKEQNLKEIRENG